MKQLTEPQAWREIARRFAERPARDGEEELWYDNGMCQHVGNLRAAGRIGHAVREAMERRLSAAREEDTTNHREGGERSAIAGLHARAYAFDSSDAEVRVLAALFLALDAEAA